MKRELDAYTPEIMVELRAAKDALKKGDIWPLATLKGGLTKMSIRQRQTKAGMKTTIEFVSEDSVAHTVGIDRAARRRAKLASAKEASPAPR